jgi:Calcineurin-like phosphoesterase
MLSLRLAVFIFGIFCKYLCAANAPTIVEQDAPPDTLFAIGDVHGDLQRLSQLLSASRIAEGSRWTGGRSVLVVTGDMVDKGPHSVEVLRLLSALRESASQAGGRVILLAGNHEMEFLADPAAEKSGDFAADLRKAGYDPERVAACEGDLGHILCSLPFAARVGEWFFSHAGNTEGRTISQLNSEIRAGFEKDGFAAKQLIGPTSILEARLGAGNKWFAAVDEHRLLESYAAALNARHIVQGHQHNEVRFADGMIRGQGEMFQRWGLLFLIDVGMSRDIDDSTGAVLRVRNGMAEAVCSDGTAKILWQSSKVVDAGRVAPCR